MLSTRARAFSNAKGAGRAQLDQERSSSSSPWSFPLFSSCRSILSSATRQFHRNSTRSRSTEDKEAIKRLSARPAMLPSSESRTSLYYNEVLANRGRNNVSHEEAQFGWAGSARHFRQSRMWTSTAPASSSSSSSHLKQQQQRPPRKRAAGAGEAVGTERPSSGSGRQPPPPLPAGLPQTPTRKRTVLKGARRRRIILSACT